MKTLVPAVAALASLLALQSGAQDMAAQKWTSAKVVKYRVEGAHNARVPGAFGDYEGGELLDAVHPRKSFTSMGAENWAWTFTPTLLQ